MKLIKDILSIFNMAVGDSSLADKERKLNAQGKELMALKIIQTFLLLYQILEKRRVLQTLEALLTWQAAAVFLLEKENLL